MAQDAIPSGRRPGRLARFLGSGSIVQRLYRLAAVFLAVFVAFWFVLSMA
ncbi:MAG: hypothetical protein GWN58_36355, partial [Anaerolineae bacterium]|nr:hypothetical protein [Anaerolineae bacterium]